MWNVIEVVLTETTDNQVNMNSGRVRCLNFLACQCRNTNSIGSFCLHVFLASVQDSEGFRDRVVCRSAIILWQDVLEPDCPATEVTSRSHLCLCCWFALWILHHVVTGQRSIVAHFSVVSLLKSPRPWKNENWHFHPPLQKNPRPPPPLKRGILWAERSIKCQATRKLVQPFPTPELRAEKSRTWGFFWVLVLSRGLLSCLAGAKLSRSLEPLEVSTCLAQALWSQLWNYCPLWQSTTAWAGPELLETWCR